MNASIDKSRYITPAQLASRWQVSLSAVYGYKAGTEKLTRVCLGKAIRFIRAEVEALERELESGSTIK